MSYVDAPIYRGLPPLKAGRPSEILSDADARLSVGASPAGTSTGSLVVVLENYLIDYLKICNLSSTLFTPDHEGTSPS